MKFLIKRLSLIFLIISFSILIYTIFRSEIIWDGDNREYYKIYYLISSILICFSLITFFINQEIKKYLIIIGFSVVLSLYIVEIYLTFNNQLSKEQFSKEKLYENQTGNEWDRRERIEIYKDLLENDKKITLTTQPENYLNKNNYLIIPLSGISNSKTINCNENGYYSIYQSDRYGFNNPDEEWDKKEIEYLLVGDSFTLSSCVNRPNDIGSVLRTLSNKSVLNLAQRGNGPLIEYATLREYLDKNVNKVLWIYFEGNDLNNLLRETKTSILINYLKDLNFTQNLKLRQNEIDDFASIIIEREKKKREKERTNKFVKFIKITNIRNLILSILPEPKLAPEFKKILKLTKELVNKNNSKLYFVYLPEYSRYKAYYNNTDYNFIKKTVSELNIPFIDTHKEVFENEQNPFKLFPFELPGHYNVEGYQKVAETIYKFTKD